MEKGEKQASKQHPELLRLSPPPPELIFLFLSFLVGELLWTLHLVRSTYCPSPPRRTGGGGELRMKEESDENG